MLELLIGDENCSYGNISKNLAEAIKYTIYVIFHVLHESKVLNALRKSVIINASI